MRKESVEYGADWQWVDKVGALKLSEIQYMTQGVHCKHWCASMFSICCLCAYSGDSLFDEIRCEVCSAQASLAD